MSFHSKGGRFPATRGFTLIELLVVILIIMLVSAVALPTVLPAINHRQVSEAARILQGALVGARDKAIHDGRPSGIRLLPDPAFNGVNPATGLVDPAFALAFNRVIPIDPAPEYSEGYVTVRPSAVYGAGVTGGRPCLVLEEAPADKHGAPNPPTSWFWNARVGDRVQINNAGPWYTIVGPMGQGPAQGNSEMFCNVGPPGSVSPLNPSGNLPLDFLLLTNGVDDNGNGWVDEGWDGVDNDGQNGVDDRVVNKMGAIGEWEQEQWHGAAPSGMTSQPYTIRRRPLPSPNAREIALPTQMVVDASTALLGARERSRLPINPFTGAVEILINPDGTVAYSSPYGSPSSFGMGDTFYHFWLAERQDLASVLVDSQGNAQPLVTGAPYHLPIAQPAGSNPNNYPGPYLKGDYSVLTLSTRTGQIVVNANPAFLDSSGAYNATYPFIPAEQGVTGGP